MYPVPCTSGTVRSLFVSPRLCFRPLHSVPRVLRPAPRRNRGFLIENILFSKSEQKRLFFFASPQANYLFQEEIQKKIVFQGQFAKKRASFSRMMAKIPNRGMKSIKKLSDSIRKQEKDIFIFCISQKMNLF